MSPTMRESTPMLSVAVPPTTAASAVSAPENVQPEAVARPGRLTVTSRKSDLPQSGRRTSKESASVAASKRTFSIEALARSQ